MTERRIDGGRAAQTLSTWSSASGSMLLTGTELGEGLSMALLQAEALAVTAGIRGLPVAVPTVEAPFAMRDLGTARQLLRGARSDVAVVYLATHGAVRLAMRSARYAMPWELPRASLDGIGVLPAIPVGYLVLAGVGLAASVLGVSWWKTETDRERIKVDGDAARAAQVASTVASLAQPYVLAGQPIPPGLIEPLTALAKVEQASPVLPWVGAALLVGGVVGAAAGAKWGGRGALRGRADSAPGQRLPYPWGAVGGAAGGAAGGKGAARRSRLLQAAALGPGGARHGARAADGRRHDPLH